MRKYYICKVFLIDMPRDRISITIDKVLLNWIDREVKSRRFSSRSHALEYVVSKYGKK